MSDTYIIKFYSCPAHLPFFFAIHPWVVVSKNDQHTRCEVLHKKYDQQYLYINQARKISQGIAIVPGMKFNWKGSLVKEIRGGRESLAAKIYKTTINSQATYQHSSKYQLYPGPNSNTYIQWIIE